MDAKGDWLILAVDRDGVPQGAEVKLEAGKADLPTLAKELGEALGASGVRSLAVGHGKAIRKSVQKLREVIHMLGAGACVHLVNEAGLSNYANSEAARTELSDHSVPARQAISLARIRRLYFGAYDPKGGGVEHGARVFSHPTCHHSPEVYGGLQEADSAGVLKRFFEARRR